MATAIEKRLEKAEKKNDSLTRRMRRNKDAGEAMASAIAGGVGRGSGALIGGALLADKNIKGVNVGWLAGPVGLALQAAYPTSIGGQLFGGMLEGPMNGLLYKKGEEMGG